MLFNIIYREENYILNKFYVKWVGLGFDFGLDRTFIFCRPSSSSTRTQCPPLQAIAATKFVK